MKQKTVILITGPTASGKTSLALELAQQYKTSIISADSRQCYREMNIGVAKPSAEELSTVHHYFINSHSIHDDVNAMTFAASANAAADEIFSDHDVAIMAGGTGLYIKAFAEGLDEIPEVPADIRRQVMKDYDEKGIAWLQEQVKYNDPVYFASGEILNPQRMMRALEVKLATGRSIKHFQDHKKENKNSLPIKKFALDIPRDELYRNINHRVELMMEKGLLEEVKMLYPFRNLNALQTVGYTELFDFIDGKLTLHEAVEKIKQNTRHYAKRQLTWFRKDPDIKWIKSRKEIF